MARKREWTEEQLKAYANQVRILPDSEIPDTDIRTMCKIRHEHGVPICLSLRDITKNDDAIYDVLAR